MTRLLAFSIAEGWALFAQVSGFRDKHGQSRGKAGASMAPVARSRRHSNSSRTHVVLVPGFAGFDALGQMEYYAGVTPEFRKWKDLERRGEAIVLHYFDNFPTAAVVTRARRLRSYLAKRIARGEIVSGDRVALVGHSTGGLDIRRLLWDLAQVEARDVRSCEAVDGTHGSEYEVAPSEILDMVKRVVFLSVPQFGTNIADWVISHALERHAMVVDLRASIATSQVPVLDRLQAWLTGSVAGASNLDLLYAMRDALAEAEPPLVPVPLRNRPAFLMRKLLAEEAASELALWMRHICSDFSAIEDLSAEEARHELSPAHFSDAIRQREMSYWEGHGIATKSYASLGARPFDFDPNHAAPGWHLVNVCSWPETTKCSSARAGTDVVYRTCYRACAGGPFEYTDIRLTKPPVLKDENGQERSIAIWDNDGIVNTASMLWPNRSNTVLINADHMDIVGHYHRVRSTETHGARVYDTYDLLKSGSGFDSTTFETVWKGVFEFCVR